MWFLAVGKVLLDDIPSNSPIQTKNTITAKEVPTQTNDRKVSMSMREVDDSRLKYM